MSSFKERRILKELEKDYTFAEMAIGDDAERYIKVFEKIARGKFIVPSYQAGISGFAWLIYRRAGFVSFWIYLVLVMLSFLILKNVQILPVWAKMLGIFGSTHIVFYFIGNFLYWCSIRRKVDSFRETYGDTSALTYLGEQGGTIRGASLLASIIVFQGTLVFGIYAFLTLDVFVASIWNALLGLVTY